MPRSNSVATLVALAVCASPLALTACGEGDLTPKKTAQAQTTATTTTAAATSTTTTESTPGETTPASTSGNSLSVDGESVAVDVTCERSSQSVTFRGAGLNLTVGGIGEGKISVISGDVNGASILQDPSSMNIRKDYSGTVTVDGDLADADDNHTLISGVVTCDDASAVDESTTTPEPQATTESGDPSPTSAAGGSGSVLLDGVRADVIVDSCTGDIATLKASSPDLYLVVNHNGSGASLSGILENDALTTPIGKEPSVGIDGDNRTFSGTVETIGGVSHQVEGRYRCP